MKKLCDNDRTIENLMTAKTYDNHMQVRQTEIRTYKLENKKKDIFKLAQGKINVIAHE